LSPSGKFSPFSELGHFPNHSILKLSELPTRSASLSAPAIIVNDGRHRMLELYTAADYAFVVGANNIFEPLRAKCPTLVFKSSFLGLLSSTAVSYYHPLQWDRMVRIAESTGGAISIESPSQAPLAYPRLFAIHPPSIRNPAFVRPPSFEKTPFDQMLDDLEASILKQLHTGKPPVGFQ